MSSKIFRLLLLTPAAYWLYRAFEGTLGADPAKSLNHKTGNMALYYILGNLAIGILIGFSFRFPRMLRFLLTNRRFLGVVSFVWLIFHVSFYFVMENFADKAFIQLVTKTYLIFGVLSWLIMAALAITSNDLAVRNMGMKNWKRLHRLIYLASFLLVFHLMLIEKADLIKYGILMGALWCLQIARFARKSKYFAKTKT